MSAIEYSGALSSWRAIFPRCLDPLSNRFHRYGGRGITICDRWYDFRKFIADMGGRPEGTSLDRVDNDGNYEPSNCRWATSKQQMRNTSRNVRVSVDGQSMLQVDAARMLGVRESTIMRRRLAGKRLTARIGMAQEQPPTLEWDES